MKRTLLISGHLFWPSVEWRSDRYGCVMMNDAAGKDLLLDRALDALAGRKGKLVAKVTKPVESKHIGDLVRCIFPSLPNAGEVVVLGDGTLFIEHFFRDPRKASAWKLGEVYDVVGLKPSDRREHDWLDPHCLYRLIASEVNLFFDQ